MLGKLLDSLRHSARNRSWHHDAAVGRRGEDLAHRFLKSEGYVIVARNYRLTAGDSEADLIAWEGDTLAIVEVKSRSNTEFSLPERAYDADKRRKLQRAAAQYARRTETPLEYVRFDLVTVVLTDPPQITLFRGTHSRSATA
jgi:putative endonuclease